MLALGGAGGLDTGTVSMDCKGCPVAVNALVPALIFSCATWSKVLTWISSKTTPSSVILSEISVTTGVGAGVGAVVGTGVGATVGAGVGAGVAPPPALPPVTAVVTAKALMLEE